MLGRSAVLLAVVLVGCAGPASSAAPALDNMLFVSYYGRVTDEPTLMPAIRVVIDSVN